MRPCPVALHRVVGLLCSVLNTGDVFLWAGTATLLCDEYPHHAPFPSLTHARTHARTHAPTTRASLRGSVVQVHRMPCRASTSVG